ncbi:antitoxin VapB family protein [Halococcus agarilyticus]
MSERVTIKVHKSTWEKLNSRKQPGDSFDDVINTMLKSSDK